MSMVNKIVFSGRSLIASIFPIKSVVSLMRDLIAEMIGCKLISTKWEIFSESALMELTTGLPELFRL